MRKNDQNKLNMFRAVRSTFKKHENVWTEINAFVRLHDKFIENLEKISFELKVQSNITGGVRRDKVELKSEVSDLATRISGAIVSMSIEKNDNHTVANVDKSRTFMMHGREVEALSYFETLLEIAKAKVTELAEYGIDPAVIDEFENKVSDYTLFITSPRLAIARRKVATARLKKLFRATTRILTMQLDRLMANFEDSDSSFYEDYFSARVIINFRAGNKDDEIEDSNVIDDASDKTENTDEVEGGASEFS